MQMAYSALQAQGLDTGAALRVLRQLVIERLVVVDCDGTDALTLRADASPRTTAEVEADRGGHPLDASPASLNVVTSAMTELAELALDIAVCDSRTLLDALHGAPQATGAFGSGAPQAISHRATITRPPLTAAAGHPSARPRTAGSTFGRT